LLMEQYGGADGELAAALRYLNQRYTIPDKVIGLLTDIGTEEFAHLEMIATMVYKMTKDATPRQLEDAGLGPHFVAHEKALFY
ncbi:manganese catalase family protein, partial [Paenibacillus sp. MER 180]